MYTFTTTKQIRLSVAFALTFIAIASLRITTQGLYYDEVHQATASFAYQGSPSKMFSAFDIAGFPVLNMPYSGAIKTSIYGIYLKFFGAKFSILSWRLTGIIIAGFGLLIFYINISNHLRPAAHSFLHFLIVTDMTILLTVRHDWGPVALSFFIRLLFIGIWIKFERIPPVSHWIGTFKDQFEERLDIRSSLKH